MGKIKLALLFALTVFIFSLVYSTTIREKISAFYEAHPLFSKKAKEGNLKIISIDEYQEMVKSAIDNLSVTASETAAPQATPKEKIKPKIIVIEE